MTMKQQSSPFIVPDWLKWPIIVLMVVFVLVITLAVWLYVDVQHDRTSQDQVASSLAVENTKLDSVQNVTLYNGEQTVHIVKGTDESGGVGLAFVQADQKEILEYSKDADILSLSEMKKQWRNSCDGCSFKKVQYAYEEGEPVFEITYIDQQQRYVFDYFTLTGDSFDQRFAFKQN